MRAIPPTRPSADRRTKRRADWDSPPLFERGERAEAGGLLAYGPSYAAIFRRGAFYVDRLLKGVKPADLPFEQPNQFELVLNLKTAKALGLPVPQALLLS